MLAALPGTEYHTFDNDGGLYVSGNPILFYSAEQFSPFRPCTVDGYRDLYFTLYFNRVGLQLCEEHDVDSGFCDCFI
ncbi:hypothetical protein SUGI_0813830 [Cryptomeria japonica]|nr:hypothetical protein SUGI_0813830 [Cryptomeria japonica]